MEISVTQAEEIREKNPSCIFLDVRQDEEVAFCQISDAFHIPLAELPNRFHALPNDQTIIVYCHHGMRSLQAVQFLRSKGLNNAINLQGGIHAWSTIIDPLIPTY